ncbi:MAG: bifunctional [glutamate--ammonia ligase]-adenylyl-L-tyrosine phosphorylase/[glutamate--ammonia-ligase] adenylyltransferase [Chromatiales bacterium]|jgi:[glutamine synthetase] adenylyltransferase / [glutamine synthetase]-adenylyl-L-tyrosine phosphorylase|nr:bifunctional [glutamate--ammonia ligase]-adenylyl-L-tyrosine phosphorylase/[glutamate--ammonia-ligase] adenylyltransferase [Chromatiales bacterium]
MTLDARNYWSNFGQERVAELVTAGEINAPDGLPGDATRVMACSDFVFNSCLADEGLLAELLNNGFLVEQSSAEHLTLKSAEVACSAQDEADLMRRLRRLRKRHMLRIAWRDIGGLATFDESVAETSWLADAIIDAALERLYFWACQQRGTPCDKNGTPIQLIVLALGKLGASELNFSSDIDLIFAFAASGKTEGVPRSESNDEFFVRLARRLIHVLDHTDRDGFVYRVDMRLRPFGDSGPLVTNLTAVEDYYETHGRDWERYALIRARAVAGDRAGGEQLLETLRPFIYRRYIDFGALESIREMKLLINSEVNRGNLARHLKLGPGGIREIEFVAQAFQLLRGGRILALRSRQVLTVLKELAKLAHLNADDAGALGNAYRFLRQLEHRLQQVGDQQTHVLPDEPAALERLGFSMGFGSWAAVEAQLDQHRATVREQFDLMFGLEPEEAHKEPLTALVHVNSATAGASLLREGGFEDAQADAAFKALRRLLDDARVRHLSERGHQRLARVLPPLVRGAAKQFNPAVTLTRLCELLAAIVRRSTYLSLLIERPEALRQLIQLCSGSALIAGHIQRCPVVLDELLDPRTLYAPLRKSELKNEFARHLEACVDGDLDAEMDALRREKQTNVLRVAAADLACAMPLMMVSDHLTEIAEVCVEHALAIAWRDLVGRHGLPRCRVDDIERTARFAVIGYGKLGGIELSYDSDLDLVYLHDSEGSAQQTSGPKVVDNEVFFARLSQRIGHILSTKTVAGTLYEVDLRLRPSGGAGLLVSSLRRFSDYQLNEAWTWEHQALVRARFIAGDIALRDAFNGLRTSVLVRPRDIQALRGEAREMRSRMRAELRQPDDTVVDLKQDAGGIADIEFLVQFLTLSNAQRLGDHLGRTDNIRLLEGMQAVGIVDDSTARLLNEAYQTFRTRVHSLALQLAPPLVERSEFSELRSRVSAVWTQTMES